MNTVVELPNETEIRGVMRKLKSHKSPGENNITAEMLKCGGETAGDSAYRVGTAGVEGRKDA